MPRRGCVCAPKKATRLILEDNDPTGYRPKKGVVAKGKAKLSGSDFPKRGPDLNPCDYGLWREVDRRTRKQEKKFAKGKTEARKQHAKRLSRTAKNLSVTLTLANAHGGLGQTRSGPGCPMDTASLPSTWSRLGKKNARRLRSGSGGRGLLGSATGEGKRSGRLCPTETTPLAGTELKRRAAVALKPAEVPIGEEPFTLLRRRGWVAYDEFRRRSFFFPPEKKPLTVKGRRGFHTHAQRFR